MQSEKWKVLLETINHLHSKISTSELTVPSFGSLFLMVSLVVKSMITKMLKVRENVVNWMMIAFFSSPTLRSDLCEEYPILLER